MRTAYHTIIYERRILPSGCSTPTVTRYPSARLADVYPRLVGRDQGQDRPLGKANIERDILLTNDS